MVGVGNMAANESLETMVARIDERVDDLRRDFSEFKTAQTEFHATLLKHEQRISATETLQVSLQHGVTRVAVIVGALLLGIVIYVLKHIGFPTDK